jgi:hypothetical protein
MIEVLVVVGLMIVLMMMSVPAFEKLAAVGGVDGAARMVTGELRLARQYAISKRKYVAVVMPDAPGLGEGTCYAGLAAYEADAEGGPYSQVPNSSWEFMPVGAIIAEADADRGVAPTPGTPTPNGGTTITIGAQNARAVVFRPTGALTVTSAVYITVAEGFYTNAAVMIKNQDNTVDVEVNPFTGNVRVQ